VFKPFQVSSLTRAWLGLPSRDHGPNPPVFADAR
jgi:hypothetical protein